MSKANFAVFKAYLQVSLQISQKALSYFLLRASYNVNIYFYYLVICNSFFSFQMTILKVKQIYYNKY